MEGILLTNIDTALTIIEEKMRKLRSYINNEEQTHSAINELGIVQTLRYNLRYGDSIEATWDIERGLGFLADSKFPEDKLNSIRTEYKGLKEKCEAVYRNRGI